MHERFLALLDEHHQWPQNYTFKFVVPVTELPDLQELFPGAKAQLKYSNGNKYVSYTLVMMMESGQAVIAVYQMVQSIKGIISL